MRHAARFLSTAWAVVLAALMLGPALGHGYVLTFDMVWVPDLALRSDFLGLGTALPRAVPSDAVVAVLDELVPGMVLQKVMLLGALVGGGIGAARLAGRSVLVQLVAVSVYVWSPFVVERLWIGHWPLLLCWAVLPWLVLAAARFRDHGRLGAAIPLLLLIGSLSANAGAMTGLVVLAVGLVRRRGPALRLVLAVLAANAPWIVAGLLHADTATTTATSVFSLRGEGPLPGPLAALTLGGIWNASVVPSSRDSIFAWVSLVLVVGFAVAGTRPLWRRLGARTAGALAGLWVVGFGLACWSWAAPGSVEWWADNVPGGGLVRDGARSLALGAPLTAALVAGGVGRLADRASDYSLRVMVGVAGALIPVALIPDAAWGLANNLAPASYPADYAAARAVLADPPPGDLLVLPFTSYRAPAWNHGRRVLDPLPRYLQPDYVVNDQLAVGNRILAGEDPRTPQVLAALAEPDPESRAAALGALGIGVVARELDVATSTTYDADVAGDTLYRGADLELVALDTTTLRPGTDAGWVVALALAWASYVGLGLLGFWNTFQKRWRGIARQQPPE